uniref:G2/mitotic-specific cyclin-B3 n=1 Tax=Parascaris univalens TaxID=6257 RepID=A0A915A608_PARUN
MMLRSRQGNNALSQNHAKTLDGETAMPVKRHAVNVETDAKDQPKRRRAGLSDLSNAISNNLLIDSGKKICDKDQQPKRRGAMKILEAKEEMLPPNADQQEIPNKRRLSKIRDPPSETVVGDDSVMLIDDADAATVVETEDPCPEYDFDAETASDPFAISMYAFDIFKYYVFREGKFRVGDYLKKQPQITKEMRAVLADWMVEVQENFELNHETLYLAVKLTDLYLDKVLNIGRDDLQLIASTAIFIASKFDERSPPLIDDFMYICEDSFTREALIGMEQKILKAVGFDLGSPLSYRFLRRYARVCKMDMGTLTLARYILETSLMFYEFVPVSESLMAAACFLMALRMKGLGDWSAILTKYSGYRSDDVEPLMWRLNHMMVMRPKIYDRLATAYNKYSHEVFYHSAAVPLLDDIFPASEPVGPPSHLSFPVT